MIAAGTRCDGCPVTAMQEENMVSSKDVSQKYKSSTEYEEDFM